MGIKTDNGFTIIEAMLFLAVAGALTVAVLAGSGVAINQQRYRDSVNSFKSLLQEQYSEATNVVNDRDGTQACANATVVSPPDPVTPQSRGTSDCMVMGRLVTIDNTGKLVQTASVVGYRTSGADEEASDIAELQTNYKLGTSSLSRENVDIAWGAMVVKPHTTQAMPLTMLILRSPLSGSLMTYTSEGVVTNVLSMVSVANASKTVDLCINAASISLTGHRMAVQIMPYATGQGSIQVPPEQDNICD
jgi:type II secretory pathway pseudopilin PulG